MKGLMPFDEINQLEEDLVLATYDENGVRRSRKDRSEVIDEVWDLLVLSYIYGTEEVAKQFGLTIEPDTSEMNNVLFKQYNGKDFRARVGEYYDSGDYESIDRVIETESHRLYNDGILNAAEKARSTPENSEKTFTKRWVTMMDDRVRDTHDYLEGVRVPIDEKFYTFDGDSALYPGGFEDPGNNINCRCKIKIETA